MSSVHKKASVARIGGEKLTFVDTEWRMKENFHGPGPGAYARFSDFSGIEKVPSVPAHESNAPAVFTGSP